MKWRGIEGLESRALFSPCERYRYYLTRILPVTFTFDERKWSGPSVMFIGLNPSTADAIQDDPTIRRCRNFASAWGFTSMIMTNIFAWRDTFPANMKASPEPIGAENDKWLKEVASRCELRVAAWGNHGQHLDRSKHVRDMLPELHCLRTTSLGEPEHPLYLKKTLTPIKL